MIRANIGTSMAAKQANGRKIRILIVINTLGAGGEEIQLARVISHFDRESFDVQVAYYNNANLAYPAELLESAGIKVIYLDRPNWGRLGFFFRTAGFMKRENFDLVHGWAGTANLYGRVPAIMAGVPGIVGGLAEKHTAPGILGSVYSITNWRCSGWIVNARAIKETVQRSVRFIKRSPIFVVPYGLDAKDDQIFKRDEKTVFDNLRTTRPVVGIVGRLSRIKNHCLFIKMARHLLDSGVDADFWIIGHGPQQSEIQAAIKNNRLQHRVKMLGYRTDVDVALARMDVFVLTSDSEGCPNAILEAMRASLPVVSTGCSSLEDMIVQGHNGYIVPTGDAPGLAERVRTILADPKLCREMGQNSRKILEQRYNMSVAARRLQDVYVNCLKSPSNHQPALKNKLKSLGLL